jgi:hypothetical protein
MSKRVPSQAGSAGEARLALDQALHLVEALAAQLDDAQVQAAFPCSPLVQELRHVIAALSANP